MKQVRWLVASAALAVAGVAQAGEFSSTITATTDYDFRGVTQTTNDPALQVSLDYAWDNGVYAGIWASNVDFGSCCGEQAEVDYYVGYAGGDEEGLTYDVGALWYAYPGATALDYPEVYAGVAYGMFDAKVWYSWDFFNVDESAYYIEGNASLELPGEFGLGFHVGYSDGKAFDLPGFEAYMDYSIALSKTLGNFDVELKWADGSDWKSLDGAEGNVLDSSGRVILSVSTTLPWGE